MNASTAHLLVQPSCAIIQCDTGTSSGHGWSLQETRTELSCTHVSSWAQITDHAGRQLCRQGPGSTVLPLCSALANLHLEMCPVLGFPMLERQGHTGESPAKGHRND